MGVNRNFFRYHERAVEAHAKLTNEVFGGGVAFLNSFQELLSAAVSDGSEILDKLIACQAYAKVLNGDGARCVISADVDFKFELIVEYRFLCKLGVTQLFQGI